MAEESPSNPGREDLEAVEKLRDAYDTMRKEMARVIVGQGEVIEELFLALFSRGHCLLQGVPGLAKTLMISTLARILDLSFNRIQFTPDLMPSDITGTDVIQEDKATGTRELRFIKGPIFANVILADEINRTPPKTQAALLEAMQENQVTAGGKRYPLEPPFFVLATQNPIEQEGTYPLPEAQLDRFMFEVWVDYPDRREELEILRSTTGRFPEPPLVVLEARQVLELQAIVRSVPVSDYVLLYAADLARATRPGDQDAPDFVKKYVTWGAGPRAGQYLVLGAKARAVLHGRVNVTAADVRAVAPLVLRHRVFVNFTADSEGVAPEKLVEMLLQAVPEPGEKDLRNLSGGTP